MLPPPRIPKWIVIVLLVARGKIFEPRLDVLGGLCSGEDEDSISEGHRLMRFQSEAQLLFCFAEHFLSQRICREQSVAPCVPVGGITGVRGMIEYRKSDGFVCDRTC